MDRKGMKANARKAYKRHYWMIVVICLFASVFGVAYSSSTWSVNASSPSATVQEDGTAQSDNVSKVLENLLVGDESQARRQVEHNQEQIVQNDTNAMMGRKRGVFASLLNSFSSGSVILSMADAANSIVHNDGVAVAVPIVVSLAVYLFVWLFVQQKYRRFSENRSVYWLFICLSDDLPLRIPPLHCLKYMKIGFFDVVKQLER